MPATLSSCSPNSTRNAKSNAVKLASEKMAFCAIYHLDEWNRLEELPKATNMIGCEVSVHRCSQVVKYDGIPLLLPSGQQGEKEVELL
jgi:hypothetical protein